MIKKEIYSQKTRNRRKQIKIDYGYELNTKANIMLKNFI